MTEEPRDNREDGIQRLEVPLFSGGYGIGGRTNLESREETISRATSEINQIRDTFKNPKPGQDDGIADQYIYYIEHRLHLSPTDIGMTDEMVKEFVKEGFVCDARRHLESAKKLYEMFQSSDTRESHKNFAHNRMFEHIRSMDARIQEADALREAIFNSDELEIISIMENS